MEKKIYTHIKNTLKYTKKEQTYNNKNIANVCDIAEVYLKSHGTQSKIVVK